MIKDDKNMMILGKDGRPFYQNDLLNYLLKGPDGHGAWFFPAALGIWMRRATFTSPTERKT
jgi:hypothetical protein